MFVHVSTFTTSYFEHRISKKDTVKDTVNTNTFKVCGYTHVVAMGGYEDRRGVQTDCLFIHSITEPFTSQGFAQGQDIK